MIKVLKALQTIFISVTTDMSEEVKMGVIEEKRAGEEKSQHSCFL